MISAHIRKQGGAAVMTIPADILKLMDLQIGSQVSFSLSHGNLIVHPIHKKQPARYSLTELLEGITPEIAEEMRAETKWAMQGTPKGRELL